MVDPRYDVPVRVLRVNTRKIISDSLNAKKIFRSKDGYCRDWRGLGQLCGVNITNQSNPPADPTDFVITKWQEQERATIGQFLDFLGRIDRYDTIADTEDYINKDVDRYLHLKDAGPIRAVEEEVLASHDDQVLTMDDVCRIEQGLGPQMYDVFVLYADDEWEGARVIIERLEQENFKLCLKDRDIVAGVCFEHKAIMTLIEERCHRLLVMLSPKFVESPANKFLHLFAQSVQIETQKRKVLPCIYKNFPSRSDIPAEFRICIPLRYEELYSRPDNFWNRLINSIKPPNSIMSNNQIATNSVRLRELSNTSSSQTWSSATDSQNLDVILPDEVTSINVQSMTDGSKTISSGKFIDKDCVEENKNEKDVDLFSELRSIFKLVTRRFVPSKSKEYRKTGRVKCKVVA